ncbi:MAG: type IX secretion system membrane protein PorP/SprF [Bacteroidota bacterium]|nr:type IX secretion system membrane protein PorP/SprF [Bacteroidota bacterium]
MINRILIAIACLPFLSLEAQQLPMFSTYFYKPFVYNPALAGDKDVTEVFAINRNMFNDFQGSPVFNVAAVDGVLKKKKAYAGFLVANQRKGLMNNTNAFGTYSYRANFADDIYLKLGMSIGISDQSINYSKLLVANYADPFLFTSNQRKTALDGNAGLSFHLMGLTLGFSTPQVFGSKLKYSDGQSTRAFYQQSRHFLGSLQYEIPLTEEKEMFVVPYGLVRFVANAPLQYDGGINFNWKDMFWVGGSYRSDYAVGINAGVTLNRRFSVGYSYDYMIGDIAKYAGISHEIMLAIKLGKLKYKKGDDTLTPQDKKIMQLQKEVDELKKSGVKIADNSTNNTVPNTNTTAKNPKFQGKNAVNENGIYILTNKASDFEYSTGTMTQKGYYVVVESVFYKDYAIQEVKRYTSFGFPDADYIVDKTIKFHYVYVNYATTKEEAMLYLKDAKAAGVPDVWLQILTE